ncbi:MAG: sugar ABC transporter permease [Clostridia bacterium]|nr:sugar ABC transporter permease [Clostridia bacterium]
MKKVKKNRGIEELKSTYGRLFTTPWLIGVILFFLIPFVETVIYSFSSIQINVGEISTKFVGLEHYKYILREDPNYTRYLTGAMTNFLYSLPIILFLSLFLALLLNQKFKGRLLFRAIYFAPVIIATGEVIKLVFGLDVGGQENMGVSESLTSNMMDVTEITSLLGISGEIGEFFTRTIGRIFDLIWNCGIQIVLFIAGLQSVPRHLYEVSKVEGATKWEEFWFITFPSLGRVTLLVSMFTMIELIVAERGNLIVQNALVSMNSGIYDRTSAQLFFYFLVACAFMGVFMFVYNRFLLKRWE